MLRRTAAVVILFLVSVAPAFAGLFTTALSPEDASQLKHVAVVSVLGNTLHARQIGLTVFGNKGFDAPVPDWGLDADVRKYMQERIVASGRIKGDVEPLEVAVSERKAMLALARDKGFDAIVAVLPEQDPNDRLLPPGLGIATLSESEPWNGRSRPDPQLPVMNGSSREAHRARRLSPLFRWVHLLLLSATARTSSRWPSNV